VRNHRRAAEEAVGNCHPGAEAGVAGSYRPAEEAVGSYRPAEEAVGSCHPAAVRVADTHHRVAVAEAVDHSWFAIPFNDLITRTWLMNQMPTAGYEMPTINSTAEPVAQAPLGSA
jgi:hypothetical protein